SRTEGRLVTEFGAASETPVSSPEDGVDPANRIGSQRSVLLACHRLYQGYRSGSPGRGVDHEDEAPLARDHAVVARTLRGARGVVELSSGDEEISFQLAR